MVPLKKKKKTSIGKVCSLVTGLKNIPMCCAFTGKLGEEDQHRAWGAYLGGRGCITDRKQENPCTRAVLHENEKIVP